MTTWSISLNFAQAGGTGERVEVPTEAPPQPFKPSDASSAAAAMPPSFKSSRRVTLWILIQASMRFSACAAEDALLRGHGEAIHLSAGVSKDLNTFRDGLRFCEERHANASYYVADNHRS